MVNWRQFSWKEIDLKIIDTIVDTGSEKDSTAVVKLEQQCNQVTYLKHLNGWVSVLAVLLILVVAFGNLK